MIPPSTQDVPLDSGKPDEDMKRIVPDPGCQKATEMYDLIPEHPDEGSALALMMIDVHKESTKPHSPDCFVNRPVH